MAVIAVIQQADAAGFRVDEEHEGLTQPVEPADGLREGEQRCRMLAERDRCGQRAEVVRLRLCLGGQYRPPRCPVIRARSPRSVRFKSL